MKPVLTNLSVLYCFFKVPPSLDIRLGKSDRPNHVETTNQIFVFLRKVYPTTGQIPYTLHHTPVLRDLSLNSKWGTKKNSPTKCSVDSPDRDTRHYLKLEVRRSQFNLNCKLNFRPYAIPVEIDIVTISLLVRRIVPPKMSRVPEEVILSRKLSKVA